LKLRDALEAAERTLVSAGVDTPRVDAELLLAHVAGTTRSGLYADLDREIDGSWKPLLDRRAAREPLAYVLGEWGFRRLTLKTDARALVPRPETEIVVERCLVLLDEIDTPRVLDIGVGSGAIALALKDERRDALALAAEYARRLGLDVELRRGAIEAASEGWELVVSNPPYVDTLDGLQPELRHEPANALLGAGFHETIARTARTRFLVLEVGDGQAEEVATVLKEAGYDEVTITPDLAGIDRVVEGRR
jgi:release factor glutamine methyltransferase